MKNPAKSPIAILISAIFIMSCKGNASHDSPSKRPDPKRCVSVDIGEAADFIKKKGLKDDRLVVAHGLANPQALIWRDDTESRTFYLARVLGTERKLYYLKPVADDETPGVASEFKGHLLKWSHLDPRRNALLTNALATNYNVKIDPEQTYIIINGEKPKGCP